jgi:protein-disulfide isomerase
VASKKEQKEEARRQREEREAEDHKKARRKRRLWQVGAAAVVLIAAIVIIVAVSSSSGGGAKVSKTQTTVTSDLFSGIAQSGVTLGNPQAKVTIYEFADLQCPFCRKYTATAFPPLVEKYVKPGKVKMVWRNMTFIGPDSVTAARAAAAAGAQNKLWNFADLFYKNQQTENSGYVTDKFIETIAQGSGVDVNKLKADESAPIVEQQLGTAQQQAAQYHIDSTPTLLLQVGKGPLKKMTYSVGDPATGLESQIDGALKQAGSGT